jgi:hypothetical protein
LLAFQYIDRLGRGAYAVVDAVKDRVSGRVFAQKSFVIPAETSQQRSLLRTRSTS